MNRAIVVAAGRGVRFGGGGPKQLVDLGGRPVLAHSLIAFQRSQSIGDIILVTGAELVDACRELVVELALGKVSQVIPGGERRQDSVWAGLGVIPSDTDLVAVHDGARPLVLPEEIDAALAAAGAADGAILAVPVTDTIKQVADGLIERTIDRDRLWRAQTPQVFRYTILSESYNKAMAEGFYGTDDAGLVERLGYQVVVVPGRPENLKITTRTDLELARMLLMERQP